jgi:hypothetical protein
MLQLPLFRLLAPAAQPERPGTHHLLLSDAPALPTTHRPPPTCARAPTRDSALQQASGSHILVDQNYPEGEDRLIIIKGRGDSTTRAASMIRELILGEPGSATGIIQKVRARVCACVHACMGAWVRVCARATARRCWATHARRAPGTRAATLRAVHVGAVADDAVPQDGRRPRHRARRRGDQGPAAQVPRDHPGACRARAALCCVGGLRVR